MTKIVCISDTHGALPNDLPEGDILIHAGDICPLGDHSIRFQERWLTTNFWQWQKEQQKKYKYGLVFIGGNHDFALEKKWNHTFVRTPGEGVCDYGMIQRKEPERFYYLHDNYVILNGLKIYGSPYQRRFFDWAFNLDEPELALKWELIPEDTDVVVSHGPAYGYGDLVSNGELVGSPSMLAKLEKIQAKLYVNGHIHSGYGEYQHGVTKIVNASLVNEQYKLVNKPIVVEI